jgi:hypothetical protein
MNAPSSAGEHIITKIAFAYITHTPRGVDPDRKLQHFRSNRLQRGCFIKMALAGWLHSNMKVQLLFKDWRNDTIYSSTPSPPNFTRNVCLILYY